ncbi:putative tRNA/rRNA methyltransferase MJ1476 [Tetrabaena socialis]|uniref:Putative tRNA/rRNA methyltransferase MJ1476 n=1 Tax=Tetrabaena socialis TaxID=47790 RepID=A0A2J7ZPA9_9CHLO|nr:putative tRNA/rRNA methyltransferase MJ1476 [Tetrabaena socialis]|eukprot:PNH02091.1 putative tRNA/rRNA methyltransferase MJ1476 [Tetrabaena socialis]
MHPPPQPWPALFPPSHPWSVRVAFTRWSQSSSPTVFRVDINGLTAHPAVRRVIEGPLEGAAPPPPPPSAWTVEAAAAAAAAEARLAAAAGPAAAATSSGGGSASLEQDEAEAEREARGGSARGAGANGPVSAAISPNSQQQQQQGHQHSSTSIDAAASITASTGSSGIGQASSSHPSRSPDQTADAAGTSSSPDMRPTEPNRTQPDPAGPGRPRAPKVALVFGREELGLSDEEVDGCEVVCSVPIGRLQESLSLSHAVSIALCSIYQARLQHLATASAGAGGSSGGSSSGGSSSSSSSTATAGGNGTVGGSSSSGSGGMSSGESMGTQVVSYRVDASTGTISRAA